MDGSIHDMSLSDERIKEMKELLEKEYKREFTWEEAADSAYRLAGLAEVAWSLYLKEQEWKKKLEESPEGFHLTDGAYSCFICGTSISGEGSWHDKYGHSCIPCRDARRKRIIPVEAYRNRDSWYRMWEFDYYWDVKSSTVRKFIKQRKLKARIVPDASGRPYHYIFMIRDNSGFLPPKPKSHPVKVGENGFRLEYEKVKSPFE